MAEEDDTSAYRHHELFIIDQQRRQEIWVSAEKVSKVHISKDALECISTCDRYYATFGRSVWVFCVYKAPEAKLDEGDFSIIYLLAECIVKSFYLTICNNIKTAAPTSVEPTKSTSYIGVWLATYTCEEQKSRGTP